MEKIINNSFFKKLHRLSLFIGMMTIALPILFWRKIPDTIPSHYNAGGIADSYSDKSSLILLFFVVVMLIGLMSVVVYYIKMNMESEYSSEFQRMEMQIAYSMIIVMNLVLQLTFAYIMFCCTTGRPLGTLFLPVVLICTFAPLIFMIYKCSKINGISAADKRMYKMLEKKEEGEIYRSAVDWWLGLLLGGSLLMVVWFTFEPIVKEGRVEWFSVTTMIITALVILPLFRIRYILYKEHMLISMSIYGKVRVRYKDIIHLQKTFNPLSSAALSLKRIQIDYEEKGVHHMVLISPKDRDAFIKILDEKRS